MYNFGGVQSPDLRLNSFYLQPDEVELHGLSVNLLVCSYLPIKGYLHVCTRSLVFCPESREQSVLRLKFSDGAGFKLMMGLDHKQTQLMQCWEPSPAEFNTMQGQQVLTHPECAVVCEKNLSRKAAKMSQLFTLHLSSRETGTNDYVIVKCNKVQHMRRAKMGAYSIGYLTHLAFSLDDSETFESAWNVVRIHHFSATLLLKQQAIVFKIYMEKLSSYLQYSSNRYYKCRQLKFEGEVWGVMELQEEGIRYTPLVNKFYDQPCLIRYCSIRHVLKFRHQFVHDSIEIWTHQNPNSILLKVDQELRSELFESILARSKYLVPLDLGKATQQWTQNSITTYEYLMLLNILSNRSFNDLSQYPVFPWVIHQYNRPLNFQDKSLFRNLSLPIGAINKHRIKRLKVKQSDLQKLGQIQSLYRIHHSLPCNVKYFMIRKIPELIIRLQLQAVVPADRVFVGVEQAYYNTLNGAGDFKELIPEFYGLDPGFLVNWSGLDLGRDRDRNLIDNALLPEWSQNPTDFLAKMRSALQCKYVRENLNQWIDLIFGYKQKGDKAIKSNNDFDAGFFEENFDHDKLDWIQTQANKRRIRDFGQMPLQLFPTPHPVYRHDLPSKEQQHRRLEQTKSLLNQLAQLMKPFPKSKSTLPALFGIIQEEQIRLGVADPASDSSLGSEIKGDLEAIEDFFNDQLDI